MSQPKPPSVAAPKDAEPPGAGAASHAAPAEQEEPGKDVVVVHGITADGAGLQVIRHRDDQLEAGAVRPLKPGRPIYGELVRLKPRKSCPLVCDVEVELPAPTRQQVDDVSGKNADGPSKGPAQVASDRYRANWDAIWSRS